MSTPNNTVDRFIATYTPQMPSSHWTAIAEFVRDAVRDSGLDTFEQVRRTLIFTATFVRWAVTACGLPLERDEIFTVSLIEEFTLAHRTMYSTKSAERMRLSLLRLTTSLTDDRTVPRLRGSDNDRRRPYTRSELANFASWADGQSSPRRRHNALTILTLGVGCGLRPAEMRNARSEDIRTDTDTPGIHVGGTIPRFVPVLAGWTEELERVAAGSGDWVFCTEGARDQAFTVSQFIAHTNGVEPRPSPSRLRSTWIVTQLNSDTHVLAIIQASGLGNLGSLDGYRPWVTPRPEQDNLDNLRQAELA